MATHQAVDTDADRIGAKNLLKEAVNRCMAAKATSSKFLQYAALAYYVEAELSNLGVTATVSIISALKYVTQETEMHAWSLEDIGACRSSIEQIRQEADDLYAAARYFQNSKNMHSLADWMNDVVKSEGKAREIVIDELCRVATDFCDTAMLTAKIIDNAIGSEGKLIVEMLRHAVKYVQHYFYRAVGDETNAYIHLDNPESRLKHCAEKRIIPEPLLKKMAAEEALIAKGCQEWMIGG